MFVSKQELKAVPFQMLHEKVTLAGRKAVENITSNEEKAYARFIARKEKEWADSNEAPDEGALREMYPFDGPSREVLLEEKVKAEMGAMEEQIDLLGLKTKASWVLPQLTAYIAKMNLPRLEDGKVDCKEFIRTNFTDDWHYGLYRVCTYATRGKFVPNQYSEQFRGYSALVPLLMMPFKKFDGIEYKMWDSPGLKSIVDPNLYRAMTCNVNLDLTPERILENRVHGLTYKSGSKVGSMRNPATTYKLYGSLDGELSELPWLAQVMYTQIWMAHPCSRTNLMVLDWKDWDNMPEALITHEVYAEPTKAKVLKTPTIISSEDALPWEV